MARTTSSNGPRRNNGKRSNKVFSSTSILNSKKRSAPPNRPSTAPPNKKRRSKATEDSEEDSADEEYDGDGGSDSEGNEWRLGEVDSDDDSDIDSDDAMGESDEERFADFTFRGSSTTKNKKKKGKTTPRLDLNEDDESGSGEEDEEEGEEGGEYIDVLDMLDRKTPEYESEDEKDEEQSETEARIRNSSKKRAASLDSDSDEENLQDSDGSDASSESDGSNSSLNDESDRETTPFTGFSEDDEEETAEDLDKMDALQELISSLPSSDRLAAKRARIDDANEHKTPDEYNLALPPNSKKLTIQDLMPSVTDPVLKKSLKLMTEDKGKAGKKSGVPGKLSVPLAKRQQDRLNRSVAAKQTKETLNRWVDTVKHNREAEHLHFPLTNDPSAPVAPSTKLHTITTTATPLTALESTISTILKQSNMASEKQIKEFEELKTNKMSLEEVQKRTAELRMARELMYREEVKAKRLKKIKSKSYHRIKRKERQKQQQSLEEAVAEQRGGVPDPEEELERERQRAEERMSLRHKQSRWATGIKQSGRNAWDEDARDGAFEMARRADELRRRIHGKDVDGSDEDDSDDESIDEFEERQEILKEIESAESLGSTSNDSKLGSKLMGMKFMQQADAAKRKENEAAVKSLREDWEAVEDGRSGDETDDGTGVVVKGRMTFNPQKSKSASVPAPGKDKNEFEAPDTSSDEGEDSNEAEDEVQITNKASAAGPKKQNPFSTPKIDINSSGGRHTSYEKSTNEPVVKNPWLSALADGSTKSKSRGIINKKQESKSARADHKLSKAKKGIRGEDEPVNVEIDMTINLGATPAVDSDDVDDEEANAEMVKMIPTHGKNAESQRELIKKAFAGDNVVAEFAKEKKKIMEDEDDKIIDDTLPGWGAWTGAGLSKKQEKRNRNKVLRKVSGVAKDKRKDAKLEKVIINEKRVKKNATFNATQLPHPYESKAQYERSMRLPIGPEWTTKGTFQQATMPRVMVKQGRVVEAMSAPFK